MKIWEMHKNMKKVKCIHIYWPDVNFHGRNLTAYSLKPHPTPNHASQAARTPHLPSVHLSSHQCQSHLVPEWITGGCMTMGKSLKLDLSCHICPRYYHFSFIRKVTHQGPSSHHVQRLVLSPTSSSSTIQSTVLRNCEFLIFPDDNIPSSRS